jgi:hypothetical protein
MKGQAAVAKEVGVGKRHPTSPRRQANDSSASADHQSRRAPPGSYRGRPDNSHSRGRIQSQRDRTSPVQSRGHCQAGTRDRRYDIPPQVFQMETRRAPEVARRVHSGCIDASALRLVSNVPLAKIMNSFRWLATKEPAAEGTHNAHSKAKSTTRISFETTRADRIFSVDGQKVSAAEGVEGHAGVFRRCRNDEERGVEVQAQCRARKVSVVVCVSRCGVYRGGF